MNKKHSFKVPLVFLSDGTVDVDGTHESLDALIEAYNHDLASKALAEAREATAFDSLIAPKVHEAFNRRRLTPETIVTLGTSTLVIETCVALGVVGTPELSTWEKRVKDYLSRNTDKNGSNTGKPFVGIKGPNGGIMRRGMTASETEQYDSESAGEGTSDSVPDSRAA